MKRSKDGRNSSCWKHVILSRGDVEQETELRSKYLALYNSFVAVRTFQAGLSVSLWSGSYNPEISVEIAWPCFFSCEKVKGFFHCSPRGCWLHCTDDKYFLGTGRSWSIIWFLWLSEREHWVSVLSGVSLHMEPHLMDIFICISTFLPYKEKRAHTSVPRQMLYDFCLPSLTWYVNHFKISE